MLAYLEAHQGSAKFLVAANGSQTTAPIIIQTGKAVVTIGGFSGQDNSPTVAQLAQMVRSGELKYIVSSGNGTLDAWVQAHGTAVDGYDGLYRLTAAVTGPAIGTATQNLLRMNKITSSASDGASRAFYEAALAPLGFGVVMERGDRVASADRRPSSGSSIASPQAHPHRFQAATSARRARCCSRPWPTKATWTCARSSRTTTAR